MWLELGSTVCDFIQIFVLVFLTLTGLTWWSHVREIIFFLIVFFLYDIPSVYSSIYVDQSWT